MRLHLSEKTNGFWDASRAAINQIEMSFVSISNQIGMLPFGVRMVPLLLLAWLLAVWRLGASDLWLDEAISFWIADRPLQEILQYTMRQANEHPPLYYALLHFWIELVGNSEFALRSLSGVGSLIAVALNATLTRRWFGDRLALLSALMLLSAPLWVLQIRDARMYSWLVALATLNIYALDRGLFSSRWRDWIPFFLSLFLMLGTHYFSALLLPGYGFYLLLHWRRLPEKGRWRLLMLLAGLGAVGGGWILSQPGPRDSLIQYTIFALNSQRSWAGLTEFLAQWVVGNAFYDIPVSAIWGLTIPLWLLALLGMRTARRTHHGAFSLTWLLILLVVIPLMLAFFILPTSRPRHAMATFGLYTMSIALGIARISIPFRFGWHSASASAPSPRRTRIHALLGAVVLIAILGLNFNFALKQMYVAHPFSVPMRYIGERARADEPIFYTYFFDWAQGNYYNRRQLPDDRLLSSADALTQEEADAKAEDFVSGLSSFWLVLFPGLDNTDRLEQAFNKLAFSTGRIWFPGDRGVVQYFAELPLQEHPISAVWENGITLDRWWSSGDVVAAGDAIRYQFEWRGEKEIVDDALLALSLRDQNQNIWTKQVLYPCDGRCPIPAWGDEPVEDRRAFYVPTDIPPGVYEMWIGWVSPAGLSLSGKLSTDTTAQADLLLAVVNILPPLYAVNVAPAPPLSKPIGARMRDDLVLTSIDFSPTTTVQSGGTLIVPMQFIVSDAQPLLDVQLLFDGQNQQYLVSTPPGPSWYPSSSWTPGRVIRVQPQFQMPGDISPGLYNISLKVNTLNSGDGETTIPIGTVQVEDRARVFDIPDIGVAMDTTCADGIRLARFDIPDVAAPGSQIPLSLIWQAAGETTRNWKVFVHLLDVEGVVRSQSDAYPLNGLALTRSWMRDEIIIDVHHLDIPANLPEGNYSILVGLYEESSGERLVCGDSEAISLPGDLMVHSR